jgi:3-isopropylmalate dehydratase small subunit
LNFKEEDFALTYRRGFNKLASNMGKTFAEKILSLKAKKEVRPGETVTISPDLIMSHDNSAAISHTFYKLGIEKVFDPSKIVIVLDHCTPPADEKYALNHKEIREFVKKQKIPHFYDIDTGICHQVLPEKGHITPGLLILGADSHTTTYGAIGAFSAGIGRSETAVIWATAEIWLQVPETLRIITLHALEDLDPDFAKRVKPGDVIVAGHNFGCGSSREQAAICLKYAGICAVIAKSFSRIFFRNAINQGLLALKCLEIVEIAESGQKIKIDSQAGEIYYGAQTFKFPSLPKMVQEILESGGLIPYTKNKLCLKGGKNG